MKGKTEIILTDATGRVERFEDTNMVTGAFSDVFNGNPYGILSSYHIESSFNGGDLNKDLQNVAGGVLCFPAELEEDAGHFFEVLSNKPTAYASNDAYSGEDSKRGTFNSVESGRVDGGYRFVWDFATNQGNGTIAAVALTHYKGGKGYYSDCIEFVNSCMSNYSRDYIAETSRKIEEPNTSTKFAKFVICYNDDKVLVVDNWPNSNSGGSIYEVPIKAKAINFNSFDTSADWTYKMDIPAGNIIRGRDYFYVVTCTATAVNWHKYNINCEDLGTGTWSLSGTSLFTASQQRTFAHDGGNHVYIFKSDKNSVYKINTSNLADIVEIPIVYRNLNSDLCRDEMAFIDGCLWLYGGIIGEDDIFVASSNTMYFLPFRRIGTWLLYFNEGFKGTARERAHNFIARSLQTNYLGTINNLSTVVTKTPDKTMKVIYTLYA